MYTVRSRKLEDFLHVHFIAWVSQDKDEFGETFWVYEETDELRRVVNEYRTLIEREKRRLSNAEPKTFGSRVYRKPQK